MRMAHRMKIHNNEVLCCMVTVWVDRNMRIKKEPVEFETVLMTYENYLKVCDHFGIEPDDAP